jgi:hypothetical protein
MAKEKHGRDLKSYPGSRSAHRWQELCTGVATETREAALQWKSKRPKRRHRKVKSRDVQGCGG